MGNGQFLFDVGYVDVDGKSITTIEGLAQEETPPPSKVFWNEELASAVFVRLG
jgi:aerobic-type carbon monoxide dehydrogenase small subunit (CoxS/CutS family)